MKMSNTQSPLAGKKVKIVKGSFTGNTYDVEDFWQNIAGKSWMNSNGNPACMNYGIRSAMDDLPLDNNVLYGKIGGMGHLVHVSEVEEVN